MELVKDDLKYIICDCAPQDWGKTETLLIVKDEMINKGFKIIDGPKYINADKENKKDDCYCLFKVSDKDNITIAILTYGDREDDNSIENEYLEKIKKTSPDIIICASSWLNGKVYPEIENIADKRQYKLITFSNYHSADPSLNKKLYQESADSIMRRIENIVNMSTTIDDFFKIANFKF